MKQQQQYINGTGQKRHNNNGLSQLHQQQQMNLNDEENRNVLNYNQSDDKNNHAEKNQQYHQQRRQESYQSTHQFNNHAENTHQKSNQGTLLKQMIKFHQVSNNKIRNKKSILNYGQQQFTTQFNFNNQSTNKKHNINNILPLKKNIHQSLHTSKHNNNTSQIKTNNKSKQHIQQQHIKQSIQEKIKNYHKHQSKYFTHLQKYLQALIRFQTQFVSYKHQGYDLGLKVSLLTSVEDIREEMERWLQQKLRLQNIPLNKPTYQWSQQQLINFFTQYQPVFLSKQTLNSQTQKLTLKKYKNCVYFGHMINGKKQGQGVIYYYTGGKVFEGKFKNDQKVYGFQIQQYNDNQFQIYIGQFEKGIRHGIGLVKNVQYLLLGRFTRGQFCVENYNGEHNDKNKKSQQSSILLTKKGFNIPRNQFNKKNTKNNINNNTNNLYNQQQLYHRQGFKLTYNSIVVYSLQLSDIMIVKNLSNDIYIGSYNQELEEKHGEGLEIFVNGDLYIGNYQNNTPQQYGEYYWASGAFYRGQFLSGMRHGKGKWQMLHGDSYQGQYMNDKKNGQGIYLWKNGSKYIGAFQNDYRHGYGEMYWNDGRSYKGQWVNGIEKNVTIQLDNGFNKPPAKTKNTFNTISVITDQKKTSMSKRYNLPSVLQKKQTRSVSNPSTRNSFKGMNSSFIIKKKITLQNIKALYNPSNH